MIAVATSSCPWGRRADRARPGRSDQSRVPFDARGSGRSSRDGERHASDRDQDRGGSRDRERERGEPLPRPSSAAGLPGPPLPARDGDRRGGGRDFDRGDSRDRHRDQSEPRPRPSSAADLRSPPLPAAPPRPSPGKPPIARGRDGGDRSPASGTGTPSVPRRAEKEFVRPSSLLADAARLVKDRAASQAAAAAARAAGSERSPVSGATATLDATRLAAIVALRAAGISSGGKQHGPHTLRVAAFECRAANSRATTAPSRHVAGNTPAHHPSICI